jgi:hypothetical protein
VRELLKTGADVAHSATDGWTALMSACQQGRVDCVHALVLDVRRPDKECCTATIVPPPPLIVPPPPPPRPSHPPASPPPPSLGRRGRPR